LSDDPILLDASALLALLQGEPGADVVASALPRGVMSAVNLSEVIAKLTEHGMPLEAARAALDGLPIEVHPFDREAAYMVAELRGITRSGAVVRRPRLRRPGDAPRRDGGYRGSRLSVAR
jgi:PIN domain nuclease of toxin-antitoxin system